MRGRWVTVALLATVVAFAVGLVLNVGAQSAQERQEQAHAARLAAAGRVLAALALPEATTRCDAVGDVQRSGGLCWETSALPMDVTGVLATDLRQAGAGPVGSRCVLHVRLGQVCEVTATVEGEPFRALIGPKPGTGPTGDKPWVTEVDGSVTVSLPELPAGEPVPVPSS